MLGAPPSPNPTNTPQHYAADQTGYIETGPVAAGGGEGDKHSSYIGCRHLSTATGGQGGAE